MWIKQEVILARSVRLYCGIDWMDWNDFARVCLDAEPARLRSIKTVSTFHPNSRKLLEAKHMRLIEGREDGSLNKASPSGEELANHDFSELKPWTALWLLLRRYGDSQCHLPHDKIYSMLPMLPSNLRSALRLDVDYSTPLLPLASRIVRNILYENQDIGELLTPAPTWNMVKKLARDWFQLDLDDPQNAGFAARRSIPPGLPSLDVATADTFAADDQTVFNARLLVVGRLPFSGRIPQPTRREGRQASDYSEDQDDNEDHGSALVEPIFRISDAMPAPTLTNYLLSIGGIYLEKEDPVAAELLYREFTGPSSLASLPADLSARVVQYTGDALNYPRSGTFLVPKEAMLGDEILICDYVDEGGQGFRYLPIVRRYAHDSVKTTVSGSVVRYSALIGFALYVNPSGTLHHGLTHAGFARLTSWESTILNITYEDIIFLAMLERAPPEKTLAQECWDPDHPSFLREAFETTAAAGQRPLGLRFDEDIAVFEYPSDNAASAGHLSESRRLSEGYYSFM